MAVSIEWGVHFLCVLWLEPYLKATVFQSAVARCFSHTSGVKSPKGPKTSRRHLPETMITIPKNIETLHIHSICVLCTLRDHRPYDDLACATSRPK